MCCINWTEWIIFKMTPCCEGLGGGGVVSEELGVRMEMNIKIHKVLEELIKYYIFKNIKEEADW